jgi:hypothetical protein
MGMSDLETEAFVWPDADHCLWCRELLRAGDRLAPDPVGTPVGPRRQHWACGLRSVIGGLNHLNGRCSCCGGDLPPDPEGVSRRMAAEMAAQAWLARNPPAAPDARGEPA